MAVYFNQFRAQRSLADEVDDELESLIVKALATKDDVQERTPEDKRDIADLLNLIVRLQEARDAAKTLYRNANRKSEGSGPDQLTLAGGYNAR